MKRILLFIIVLGWITSPMFSQITVNQSDMPKAGDTLRVSVTNVVPVGYAKSAMDTTWNYAALDALSQRVDTFVNATSTPSAYQLFFVLLGGANLASPRSGSPVPGVPVTQGFTFYKNSSGSFSNLGSGYTVQGIPLPAKYDIADKIYEFPMTPGATWSSVSSFSITIPNLMTYSTRRTRSNLVDGWGSLTTPYGTFQTLRVKSLLNIHDSLYIDSLGIGLPVTRNIIEYQWIAKGKGIPVLQISVESGLATATYRDFYRMSAQPLTVSLGPDTAVLKGTILTLHATVSGGTPPYQILWNTLDSGNTITVNIQNIRTFSVMVVDAIQNFGSAQKVVSIKYAPGVEEYSATNVRVYPNPTQGLIHFTLPGKSKSAVIQVFNAHGKLMRQCNINAMEGENSIDFSGLPEGLCFIRILTPDKNYSAKLQVIK